MSSPTFSNRAVAGYFHPVARIALLAMTARHQLN
jgi:hypothetical protein